MADWALPTETSLYTDVLDFLDYRLKDVASLFPSSGTYTNLPLGTISFRSNKWQRWNGASWMDLLNHANSEFYDIGIVGTASNIRGVAAAVNGGTGKSSYAIGDILYASANNALSTLGAVAYGNILISNGTNTAPSWGKLNLQDHTTGTLGVGRGGTGVTSISGLVKGNGTNSFSAAIAGTDYAAASHSHPYLSDAGGTLSGSLTVNGNISTNAINGTSLNITSGAPTIWMYDTDQADFAMQVNSNLWYILNQGGSGILTVDQSGNVTANGNVTAYSDRRLKTNIEPITNALSKVCALTGVYFDRDGKRGLGLIAQDTQKVVPEVVQENKKYLSLAYGNLVGLLVESIKELKAEIETLKNAR